MGTHRHKEEPVELYKENAQEETNRGHLALCGNIILIEMLTVMMKTRLDEM